MPVTNLPRYTYFLAVIICSVVSTQAYFDYQHEKVHKVHYNIGLVAVR
jgi:hypothetical protein